jgi:CRP-like cAMP-binding protein|eukprot:COSAG06_NODE_1049_length_10959_cov_25.742449_6_plen_73_part_00
MHLPLPIVFVCAGEFFGELALITNDRRSATVRASLDGPLEVFTLFKHDFTEVVESFPKLKEVIAQVSEQYKS